MQPQQVKQEKRKLQRYPDAKGSDAMVETLQFCRKLSFRSFGDLSVPFLSIFFVVLHRLKKPFCKLCLLVWMV